LSALANYADIVLNKWQVG